MKEDKKSKFLSNLFKKKADAVPDTEQAAESQDSVTVQKTVEEVTEIPEEKLELLPLFELYQFFVRSGVMKDDFPDEAAFAEWFVASVKGQAEEKEITGFTEKLCTIADSFLRTQKELEELEVEGEEGENVEPLQPEGEKCCTYLSLNQMSAFLLILPAAPGGEELTMETLTAQLAAANIRAGLNTELLEKILENKAYLQIHKIASGRAPVDGENGEYRSKIDFDSEVEIKQDEQGVSDFKNLDVIHIVSKGDVLCDIIAPTKGIPGEKVTGARLSAMDGKPIPDPAGKNTELSEDKSQLLAAVDGQVLMSNGRFSVEEVLVIKEDVDYSVGNIDFPGSVIVQGDVSSGFTVKSGRDVTIYGTVESATIVAEGNVTLQKGMNGNYSGSLEVQGDVRTSFLENCTVNVEGCLYSNSIVACQVFCGDSVFVQGRQGVIIGGNTEAYKTVEAKVIGSKNHRDTILKIGEKPHLDEKKSAVESKLVEAQAVIEKLQKTLKPLSMKKDSLKANELTLFTQLTQQMELYQEKEETLKDKLTEYAGYDKIAADCSVKGDLVFPSVKVIIGSESYIVDTETSKCMIHPSDEGLEVGTF